MKLKLYGVILIFFAYLLSSSSANNYECFNFYQSKNVSQNQTNSPALIYALSQQSKHFTFTELRAGDCIMQAGGTLDVFPNGRAEFHATVWTNHTHSGDTWHHHIYFTSAAGVVIFQVSLDGPNHMNDDGTHYPFNAAFNFPAGIYALIYSVSASGNC